MQTSRQNHTTGVVVFQQRSFKLTVPSPLLVFDTYSWTQSQKVLILDQARQAEAESDEESAREDFELAAELEAWLQEAKKPVRALPLLALRQTVKPHIVNRATIGPWIKYLCGLNRKDFEGKVEFFLEASEEEVVLKVLSTLRAQARHTGTDIFGQIITEEEMAAQLSRSPKQEEISGQSFPFLSLPIVFSL